GFLTNFVIRNAFAWLYQRKLGNFVRVGLNQPLPNPGHYGIGLNQDDLPLRIVERIPSPSGERLHNHVMLGLRIPGRRTPLRTEISENGRQFHFIGPKIKLGLATFSSTTSSAFLLISWQIFFRCSSRISLERFRSSSGAFQRGFSMNRLKQPGSLLTISATDLSRYFPNRSTASTI